MKEERGTVFLLKLIIFVDFLFFLKNSLVI